MWAKNDHMTVTIWHNPKCATSRNALAMIRASGIEPVIVEYLVNVPSAVNLAKAAAAIGGARALLRIKGTPAEARGLTDDVTDAAILAAMAKEPILIERPMVFGPKGAVLARPAAKVLSVLG